MSAAVATAPDAQARPGPQVGPVAPAATHGRRAPGPAAPRVRYPLDSLRAIAAIAVLTFHAYQNNRTADGWPWSGWAHEAMLATDLAVDLFFVISGFLLWLPVSRTVLAGARQRSGRQLLVRRAVRLLPLYYIVLLVAWSIANPVLPGHWQDLLLHLTMTQVYSEQYIFWTVGPAWTLAIEFHAYVLVAALLPVLTAVTPHLVSRGRRLVVAVGIPAVLGTVGLGYLAWAILVLQAPEDAWPVWFGPLAKAHLFALGMGLAVLVATGRSVSRGGRRALVVGSTVLVVVGIVLRSGLDPVTAQWSHVLFGVVCAGWVGSIVLTRDAQPRWLTWRPTVWIGTVSYSLYLVHELVLQTLRRSGLLPEIGTTLGVVVTAVATLTVSLAIARLSYAFVERPLIAMVDGLERSGEIYSGIGVQPVPAASTGGGAARDERVPAG